MLGSPVVHGLVNIHWATYFFVPCPWTCAANVIASFNFGCQILLFPLPPTPINILLILQGLAQISYLWSLFNLNQPVWLTFLSGLPQLCVCISLLPLLKYAQYFSMFFLDLKATNACLKLQTCVTLFYAQSMVDR